MEIFLSLLNSLFTFQVIFSLIIGVALGIFVGSLPGLTAVMAISLLVPITFWLPPSAGLAMLIGVYNSAIFAGGISAILINTPGTPASIASTFDGYKLVKHGYVRLALWINTFYSVFGGLFGAIMLTIAAFPIAKFALKFGPAEYATLAVFGISMMVSVSGKSIVKGLIAGFLGLAITTIGLDPIYGFSRFSFNSIYLLSNISFVPIMIGLFGIGEILDQITTPLVKSKTTKLDNNKNKGSLSLKEIWKTKIPIIYSSLISVFIGAIPGTGGDISSIISWDQCRRFSKEGNNYGEGSTEGLAVTCASNNACLGGAVTTMLSLGIPGDAPTAVLIGSLMMYGYIPGPLLFRDNIDMVAVIVGLMFFAYVFIGLFGFLGAGVFSGILNLPRPWINLAVFCFSLVGAYAMNNSSLDILLCLGAGIFGFLFKRTGFPLGPVIIGLILGPIAESNIIRALLVSNGDITIFLSRPISLIFIIASIGSLFLLPIFTYITKRDRKIKIKKNA